MRNKDKTQPARQILFWLPIYKIIYEALRGVFRDFWKYVMTSLSDIAYKMRESSFFAGTQIILIPLIYIFALTFAFLTFCCVFFGLSIVVSIFLLITLCNYIVGGTVALIDTLFIKIKSISLACPSCQEKYELPLYICECNAEHTNLRPGKYGIFKRRCECGRRIPTTFFNGRQKMAAVCQNPDCRHVFAGDMHPARQICIPIIGGISSGKTNLINAGIEEIRKFAESPENKLEFKYCSPDDERRHQNNLGVLATKTGAMTLDAYKVYFTKKNVSVKNRVYIYDVAGEIYDATNRARTAMEKQKVYGYTNNLLFVLDPLSIDEFYEECVRSGAKNLDSYKRSEMSIDSVVSNLFNSLNAFNLSPTQMKNTFVAIAITKADMPLVNEHIGKERVATIQSNTKKTWEQAQNTACEAFLDEFGATNFLNQIKTKFTKYQFFVCSSWDSETDSYKSDGAGDPFLWLIDMECKDLDFKKKWVSREVSNG